MSKKQGSDSLAMTTYRAFRWNYIGSVVKLVAQFAIGVVLARLLGPEAFGVVAVGWLVIGFGALVADFGLSAAVVQKDSLSVELTQVVWTLQVTMGLSLSVLAFFMAPTIAHFFDEPRADLVVKVMGLTFFLQSLGQTSAALLRRDLQFKELQIIAITSYFLSYLLVGLTLAYLGFGVWSLVFAQLIQVSLSSALYCYLKTVAWRISFDLSDPSIITFGSNVMLSNFLSWVTSNVDNFIVGRVFGVSALGAYSRGFSLISMPINAITSSLQGVVFAAGSRRQNNNVAIKKLYLAVTAVSAYVCSLMAAFFFAAPGTIVEALFGPEWLLTSEVLPPLALAIAVNANLAMIGPVLMAKGRVDLEVIGQTVSLALTVPLLAFLSQYSLVAVSWGVFAGYVLRWLILLVLLKHVAKINITETLRAISFPIVVGSILCLVIILLDQRLTAVDATWSLLIEIIAFLGSVFILLLLFAPIFLKGEHGDFLMAEDRIPAPIKKILGLNNG